jgi:hypothetical protein
MHACSPCMDAARTPVLCNVAVFQSCCPRNHLELLRKHEKPSLSDSAKIRNHTSTRSVSPCYWTWKNRELFNVGVRIAYKTVIRENIAFRTRFHLSKSPEYVVCHSVAGRMLQSSRPRSPEIVARGKTGLTKIMSAFVCLRTRLETVVLRYDTQRPYCIIVYITWNLPEINPGLKLNLPVVENLSDLKSI